MKCNYCDTTSEKISGWYFDDGGSCKEEGDFICTNCFELKIRGKKLK